MTIYVDVVFLENLCMNYIILLATGLITKFDIHYGRLFLSSILGSLYAVFAIGMMTQNFFGFLLKILLSIGMIYIAFRPNHMKRLLKTLLVFYLTSFAFGGAAFALLYFLRPQDILMKNGVFIGTYPIKVALLGGIVGFTVITVAFKVIKSQISKKDLFCTIEIMLYDKNKKLIALLDTGNLLKDPITHDPVIVVEKDKLEDFIPSQLLKSTQLIIQGKVADEMEGIEEYLARLRVIPYSSLGKQHGMLVGMKVDKVVISYQEQLSTIEHAVIGLYDKELIKTKKYSALVGLELLNKEGRENEFVRSIKS